MMHHQSQQQQQHEQQPRRRISLYSTKSQTYMYTNFLKQYRRALDNIQIGQQLTCTQILQVLRYMGFVDEQPNQQDIQLSKTLTKMLCNSNNGYHYVNRANLFGFLAVLCGIGAGGQGGIGQGAGGQVWECFGDDGQAQGLPLDSCDFGEPLIVIQIGKFDQNGRWSCNEVQAQQIQKIFGTMRCKRISRNQVQSRKKQPKHSPYKSQTFQPKICPKSCQLAQNKIKKLTLDLKPSQKQSPIVTTPSSSTLCLNRVENRLLLSKKQFTNKITEQLNRSIQKQLQQCTFKPILYNKNRSQSKQNLSFHTNTNTNINRRSNSQQHLKILLQKGNIYKQRKQRLHQIKIKLDQSAELENCTFKPQTTKHSQSSKWVYVRNRDKEIQRLREGRKHRQFVNTVKQRGYPNNVNWSQFITKKSVLQCQQSNINKTPILCIDLKIMNEQFNINVYDGENVCNIAERIGKEHQIPQKMWWKVEELIKRAINQCEDVRIEGNCIYGEDLST